MPANWEALRLEHGPLVRVELGGVEFGFRRMRAEEAEAVSERFERAPELALDIAIDACRPCCVAGVDALDAAIDQYPLAFSAESGICETLLKVASDEICATIKAGIKRWRSADRQLGSVAESLLAFQAYKGGNPDAKELAGALHLAELLDYVKGTYRLHLAFMRSMGKGKR